ncbi:hypothetical protein HPB51_015651 [Rhipicephalus microplus]|uniref:Uncharacterized protein n=1 Tax=Rhipicephalus microplus TaxID=6941 RepID=A0A9J6DAR0_RHIMP|nr:hypothetical protein HPB51_015651 [Rhipicephalus microplus]
MTSLPLLRLFLPQIGLQQHPILHLDHDNVADDVPISTGLTNEKSVPLEHVFFDDLYPRQLRQLRSKRQPKKPAEGNIIHTTDDVVLLEYVKETLRRGPKNAVEPRLEAPKLLFLVRQLSGCAPDCEKDRCIFEGVDVLEKFRPKRQVLPIRKVVTYLKESGLCVIPSEKEAYACTSYELSVK